MNLKYSTHIILFTWDSIHYLRIAKNFHALIEAMLCCVCCDAKMQSKILVITRIKLYAPFCTNYQLFNLNMLQHNDILKISLPFFLNDICNILAYLLHANKNNFTSRKRLGQNFQTLYLFINCKISNNNPIHGLLLTKTNSSNIVL